MLASGSWVCFREGQPLWLCQLQFLPAPPQLPYLAPQPPTQLVGLGAFCSPWPFLTFKCSFLASAGLSTYLALLGKRRGKWPEWTWVDGMGAARGACCVLCLSFSYPGGLSVAVFAHP